MYVNPNQKTLSTQKIYKMTLSSITLNQYPLLVFLEPRLIEIFLIEHKKSVLLTVLIHLH